MQMNFDNLLNFDINKCYITKSFIIIKHYNILIKEILNHHSFLF